MLNANGFVMTPYLRIRQKSKESKEMTASTRGISPKSGDDRIGQIFCLRQRGFDRVSAGCRARERVGPKGGRR